MFYLICALLNIYVLRYLDYSTVLPPASLTYIWTTVLSFFIFKEKIGPCRITGAAVILFGAFSIALRCDLER